MPTPRDLEVDGPDPRAGRATGGLGPAPATIGRVCLLDVDGDLADQLGPSVDPAIRPALTVAVLHAEAGRSALGEVLDELREGFGLLVLDGLISCETGIGDRTAVELLGTGDLLQSEADGIEPILERHDSWQVLWPSRLAVLDRSFAERVRPWPQVARSLVRRASRRASNLEAVRAISGHPRLELRLDLAFWHLASRWGRVERTGIHLQLPLTHRMLGQLVAAERPSISHALSRLSHAGLVTGSAGDWHLVGTPREHLAALLAQPLESESRRGSSGVRGHG